MPVAPKVVRIFFGEVIGTAILVLFGSAGRAQLAGAGGGSQIHAALASGLGLTVAIVAVAGVSGCNINPAVSVGFAVVGRTKWRDIPIYWPCQYLGAFLGASISYTLYHEAIEHMTGYGEKSLVSVLRHWECFKMNQNFFFYRTLLPH
jgi:glycerol uptake facilitator-like aquaporin